MKLEKTQLHQSLDLLQKVVMIYMKYHRGKSLFQINKKLNKQSAKQLKCLKFKKNSEREIKKTKN